MRRTITFTFQHLLIALIALVTCVSLTPALYAQVASSGVSGRVTDDTGGVLPGVSLTLTNVATNQSQTVVTNQDGFYRFGNLTPGNYTFVAELTGFATYNRDEFMINVGGGVELSFAMQLSSVEETVTVTGESPIIEIAKTDMSTVIGLKEIETLPTSSRNYLDFALLTPGSVENNSTTGQGIGLNIGGARAKEGALLVDGFWNTDESFTFVRLKYSQDSIAEFEVVTLGAQAEYGRAIGGIINAVTKQGGNLFTGSGYGFFRNKSLNSQDPLSRERGAEKAEFDRQLYGTSFGGPIVRGRTFFFGSVERQQRDTPLDNSITAENAAIIGLPPEDVGSIDRPLRDTFFMGKVTHQLNENNSIQGSFVYTKDSFICCGAAFRSRSQVANLRSVDKAYQFQWTGVAREGNWLHQLRASYFPRSYSLQNPDLGGPPLTADGQLRASFAPTVNISSVARFGSGKFTLAMETRPFHVTYNSTIFKDNHSWKFGVDGMFVDFDYIRNPGRQTGFYTFRNIDDFQRGAYSRYRQQFGEPLVERYHSYVALFLQDTWRVNDRMTLNYGIRYDLEFLSEFKGQNYGEDYGNIGPRFGLSYDLTGEGKTLFKFGTGLYYDRIFQNPITPTYFDNKEVGIQVGATWTPSTPGAPTYPNTFPNELLASGTLPLNVRNVHIVPPPGGEPGNMQVPTSLQLITTVDHAWNNNFASSVSFAYTDSWDKELFFDRNLEFDEAAGQFIRPDPNFRRINQYVYSGIAEYFGLILESKYRARNFRIGGHVTFADATDQLQNAIRVPINDVRFPELDIGPMADTPTVRAVVYGSWDINTYNAVSFIYQGRTGYRIDPRVGGGFDPNGDGTFNDRTPGLLRNSFTGGGVSHVSARYTFKVPIDRGRVEFTVEAFNLLNRDNPLGFNSQYGLDAANPLPQFGTTTTFSNPREIQLGVRIAF